MSVKELVCSVGGYELIVAVSVNDFTVSIVCKALVVTVCDY